jgi:hypothetical protein
MDRLRGGSSFLTECIAFPGHSGCKPAPLSIRDFCDERTMEHAADMTASVYENRDR